VIHYKEGEQMKDVTPAELSKAEAKKLTQKIKTAVDELCPLLVRAREGKAWKALGYGTWEDYVKAEFGMSRSYAHRLIEQGEVIEAIQNAVVDLLPMGNISERTARELKKDLPAATAEIRERAEQGEKPEDTAKDIAAKRRAAKEQAKAEKAAQQAENDRIREEAAAALPQAIKDREKAKTDAITARKAKPVDVDALMANLEELREANAALDAEVAVLKADNAKWEAMRVQYEQGGFEKVIAGKDEEIRVLLTRVESESQEKVSNLRSADRWRKRAIDLGYTDREVIEING
jgi:hypothetical protein